MPDNDSSRPEEREAAHPDLTGDVRNLDSVVQLGRAALSWRSFQDILREEFGDLAELTVEPEEKCAQPFRGERAPGGQAAAAGSFVQGCRYSIENEIARGGMGVVWRVRDHDLSRTLAMKVLSVAPGHSTFSEPLSRAHLARFIEEAQVTAQLDHPGIVPVHEAGFEPHGQPFFTMKLVKGRDLDEVLQLSSAGEESWNLPRVVGVLVKACQAMAYARVHSRN